MTIIPCPTCHHLFPNHQLCGSPAHRGQAFCYFHSPDRQPLPKRQPVPTLPKASRKKSHAKPAPAPVSYECKHLQCPFRRERWVVCPQKPVR